MKIYVKTSTWESFWRKNYLINVDKKKNTEKMWNFNVTLCWKK